MEIIFIVVLACIIGILCGYIYKKQSMVVEHHNMDDPILGILRNVIKPITYNGKSITENLKLFKGNKSYTINKEQTFLCLKDQNNEYYPINMMIYVLLHEISHSLNTKDIGHTPEFHRIFQELLNKAEKLKIYNPSIPVIQGYCEFDENN